MKKNLLGAGFSSAVGLVFAVSFVAFVFFPSVGKAQTVLLETGWEDGQSLGIADKVLYSKNVAGYFNSSSPPPECSRRFGETLHSGNYSLLIAGYSKAAYAFCYYQVLNQTIPVVNGTKISYWIYHGQGTAKIAVDGHFTDGNTIRDFGQGALKDQYGTRIHPAARRDPMSQWYYVELDLTAAAGKTLDYIMFAFDNGNDGFTGPYRAYVDDFKIISGGSGGCQASVPIDHWKGEYFNNMTLSGTPVMVRDDGNDFLNFDWGTGSPNPSCGIPVDNFSARFTRTVNFTQGSYQFSATADDGVRVWIDDQLQLDKWIDQGPTTYTFGPISLAGNHTIKMEYYEHMIGAVAKLSWQGVANPCQASVPGDHWKGEYFNNMTLSGTPVMVRDDGNDFLNFDWGTGSPNPSCGIPVDNFSARFTRTVNFTQGSYQFSATADDGVRVWIDDQLQLDKWIDQGPTTYTFGPISLAGNHTIKMEYYEHMIGAVAKLSWVTIGPDGLEWPNSVSYANSDPWLAEHHREIRRMRPRILALNFVNQKSMDQMRTHMQQAIEAIAEGSRYHGYKDANAPVFIQYELAYAIDLRDPVPLPNFPYHNSSLYPRENPVVGWGLDYGKLFSAEFAQMYRIPDPNDAHRFLTLCELIERGLVHEVWIYGDQDVPDVSAAEVLELKPYYDENRQRVAGAMNPCAGNGCFDGEDVVQMNCSRTVRIAWMNNTRGVGCFLESLSHGMESFGAWNRNQIPYLSRYFVPFAGYDLNTKYGLPTDSWYACSGDDCLRYPTTTSVAYNLINQGRQGVINPYDPVCGNVHVPPNGRHQYDLESPYTVRTSCGHYRDGSGQTDDFTIQAFTPYNSVAGDCDGPFLVWWRQNMPGLKNAARDDQGNLMLNWWPFLFY